MKQSRTAIKPIAVVLICVLLANLIPIAASALSDVLYFDENSTQRQTENVTIIDASNISTINELEGWYLVRGVITRNTFLNVAWAKDAHIILEDGSELSIIVNDNRGGIVLSGNLGQGSLSIYSQSFESTMGKLIITNSIGSGISCKSEDTLIINGGDISVSANDSGAGIGGNGGNYTNTRDAGNIIINGGCVTAKGGYGGGAGIGGGRGGDGGTITINGGTIKANGVTGIGGGSDGGNGGNIDINGGYITAEGGAGAGIGGGNGGQNGGEYHMFNGGNITINGGIINASGDIGGAGIGGGDGGGGGTITINGGTITARSNDRIGGTGDAAGAGIGGGGGGQGASLGGRKDGGWGGNITINGGTVTATAANSNGGAGIGGGGGSSDWIFKGGRTGIVNINGGTITATGGPGSAGIGGGPNATGSIIRISGGFVNATGGYRSAGIGGGAFGGGDDIIIDGGTITAKHGESIPSIINAADIGHGDGASGAHVNISGGSINPIYNIISPQPGNGNSFSSAYAYRTILTLENIASPMRVTKIEQPVDYGIKDMLTDEGGRLYLWLPVGQTSLNMIVNGAVYTGAVTVTSDNKAATTLAATAYYGIRFDGLGGSNEHTFSSVSPLVVSVFNTGNLTTGNLNVSLSGANPDSFTVAGTPISTIAVGGNRSFTIKPNNDLPVGTYKATVTVSNSEIMTGNSFTVSFTVSPVQNLNPIIVNIGDANARAGNNNVRIPVTFQDNPGIGGAMFEFAIPSGLSLVNIEGPSVPGLTFIHLSGSHSALIEVDPLMLPDGYKGTAFATLILDVNSSATEGAKRITLTSSTTDAKNNVSDINTRYLNFIVTSGNVNVVAYSRGFIANDGNNPFIGMADLTYLRQYLSGNVLYPENPAMFIANNGNNAFVGTADLTYLRQHLAGNPVFSLDDAIMMNSLLLSVPAASQSLLTSGIGLTINIANVAARPGDNNVRVPVTFGDNSGIGGAMVEFSIPSGLTLVDIEGPSVAGLVFTHLSGSLSALIEADPAIMPAGYTGDAFVTLVLDIDASAEGMKDITLTSSTTNAKNNISDINTNYVDYTIIPGGVNVSLTHDCCVVVSCVTGKPDDEIDLAVSLTNNPGIAGFILEFEYNTTILTPISVTKNPYLGSNPLTENLDFEANKIRVAWVSAADVTIEELFTIRFKINSNASSGETPVTVTSIEVGTAFPIGPITTAKQDGAVIVLLKNESGADITIPAAADSKTHNSITIMAAVAAANPGAQSIEYLINTDGTDYTMGTPSTWQPNLTFIGLSPNTTYYVWARTAEKIGYNAGTPKESLAITTLQQSAGPSVGADITTAAAELTKTHNSITVKAATAAVNPGAQSIEYLINTDGTDYTKGNPSTWQSGLTFTGLSPNIVYYVWARTAANPGYYAGTPRMSLGITTLPQPVATGDVNGDGDIDEFDLLFLMQYIVGLKGMADIYDHYAADIYKDGLIGLLDAILLAQYLSNKENVVIPFTP